MQGSPRCVDTARNAANTTAQRGGMELPVLQEKDKKDLIEFGVPQGVDFVAASFVQDAADVKLIRETLGLRGRSIRTA